MTDLHNRVAVVTGSTSGIGAGIATKLAEAGASIVLNGRRELSPEIETQLAGLRSHGVEAIYVQADMSKRDDVNRLIETAAKTFGRLDILVNNAGMQRTNPIEKFPDEDWDELIAVHLTATFNSIKAAVPHMKEHGWGRIINIASAQAWDPQPFKIGYASAKGGMINMTRQVAAELSGTGITSNSISPGFVDTEMVREQIQKRAKDQGISIEAAKQQILQPHQKKEFVPVEEVANKVLFLCSEEAAHITGADYKADNGWVEAAEKRKSQAQNTSTASLFPDDAASTALIEMFAQLPLRTKFSALMGEINDRNNRALDRLQVFLTKKLAPAAAPLAYGAVSAILAATGYSVTMNHFVQIRGGDTVTQSMAAPGSDMFRGPIATSGAHVFFMGEDKGEIGKALEKHRWFVEAGVGEVEDTVTLSDGRKLYNATSINPGI